MESSRLCLCSSCSQRNQHRLICESYTASYLIKVAPQITLISERLTPPAMITLMQNVKWVVAFATYTSITLIQVLPEGLFTSAVSILIPSYLIAVRERNMSGWTPCSNIRTRYLIHITYGISVHSSAATFTSQQGYFLHL